MALEVHVFPVESGTVAQLCSHFEQPELARSNTWQSYSTKMRYAVNLRRWILPNWGKHELRNVRTIEFEYWLRRLPLAKSSCATIRGVISVLFNHAYRFDFFDRNPISLVRQGAKRKAAPNVLTPDEIKTLIDGLAIRERYLVLLAASTGLRQSELFGLKWRDVNFADRSIHVKRPFWPDSALEDHIKPALAAAGITKRVTRHNTFRHRLAAPWANKVKASRRFRNCFATQPRASRSMFISRAPPR